MRHNGDGCSEATKRLGLLELSNDTTMESRSFHTIEGHSGPVICEVTDEMLLKHFAEKVQLSMDNQSDFYTWK